ncbi:hypothetical protein PFNF54_05303 [Plasmodium falciparum NF54]|uniref:Uncharacterized protein n=1 Tax=Plasmodium falciparum (isolate NF54) TaxID=5843 RepID=W7JLS1_PLAFO|nr:hypothetical protein PFNF54_05303 [Plasmodium falciparum NF54]
MHLFFILRTQTCLYTFVFPFFNNKIKGNSKCIQHILTYCIGTGNAFIFHITIYIYIYIYIYTYIYLYLFIYIYIVFIILFRSKNWGIVRIR